MSNQALVRALRNIVGRRHVLTGAAAAPFGKGYRFGQGDLCAAVRPGSLLELWRTAETCVAAGRIIIMQAANTGLTGGSTPDGDYGRGVVVISTARLKGARMIMNGEQVVCLAGETLFDLERRLAPYGREPHSVIGSTCIGASVVGGVCNSSGGALVQRGPAYTEYALFARIDSDGTVRLHNHLGIRLGDDAETILRNLEQGNYGDADLEGAKRTASAAKSYEQTVRQIQEPTPARFNADASRLFEASGSAGKLIVFAVRLDSFPKPREQATFYIGTNDPRELSDLRRRILREEASLPVSGEYIHRRAFDLADVYGKDMVVAIRRLGTSRLPFLFRLKARVDRFATGIRLLPTSFADQVLQAAGRLFPDHLPPRMRAFRNQFEHHLILKVADEAVPSIRNLLTASFPSASGAMFECNAAESEAAMLHRFAVAGAAVRYRELHRKSVEDIVALDVALPRNAEDWFEKLPSDIEAQLVDKLYYGHFLCHVFHQDYIVRKGCDPVEIEHRILELMDARGAEYPAEHNVGHLYAAKPTLAAHYRDLDPTNCMNPGIGKTSRRADWA